MDEINKNTKKLTVVAIGASAGGQEAAVDLLQHLPSDTGMAFVYVQHLDPNHDSNLSSILGRATEMPVTEAIDHVTLQADHLYIIPPNKEMSLLNGGIELQDRPSTTRSHLPINKFFHRLPKNTRNALLVLY